MGKNKKKNKKKHYEKTRKELTIDVEIDEEKLMEHNNARMSEKFIDDSSKLNVDCEANILRDPYQGNKFVQIDGKKRRNNEEQMKNENLSYEMEFEEIKTAHTSNEKIHKNDKARKPQEYENNSNKDRSRYSNHKTDSNLFPAQKTDGRRDKEYRQDNSHSRKSNKTRNDSDSCNQKKYKHSKSPNSDRRRPISLHRKNYSDNPNNSEHRSSDCGRDIKKLRSDHSDLNSSHENYKAKNCRSDENVDAQSEKSSTYSSKKQKPPHSSYSHQNDRNKGAVNTTNKKRSKNRNSFVPLREFEPTIQEVEGDLFESSEEYSLAHCVGEDFLMSAGIAVNFKKLFGGIYELLAQRKRTGEVAILRRKNRFIFYMITKKFSTGKPTKLSMKAAIKSLKQCCLKYNVNKLAIPRIGCGLDRLDWCEVKTMLFEEFYNTGIEIVVFSI